MEYFLPMKVSVLQEDLSKALNIASRFVNKKSQLPVLGNIVLEGIKTKLLIQATNLEMSISLSIGAKVEKEGKIAVPARTFADLINNLGKGSVLLEQDKEQVNIKTESFESALLAINPNDFPIVPQGLDTKSLSKLSSKEFLEALSLVIFSSSTDEARPVLEGVLFLFNEEGISLVASDGFRLSQKKLPLKIGKNLKKMILPRASLMELAKIGSEGESISFEVKEADNQIVFGIGEAMFLTSRLIEGEFPNFEKIIPKSSNTTVLIDKESLLQAIKVASVFAREAGNIIKIKVVKEGLEVRAESSSTGREKYFVEAKVEGEPLEISYNYRFIEEFLNAIKGNEVKIEFVDSNAPGVFYDTVDSNFLHLIMPVKVES